MQRTKDAEEALVVENSSWLLKRAKRFVYDHPSLTVSHTDDLYQIGCQTLITYSREQSAMPSAKDRYRRDPYLAKRIRLRMYDYLCCMGAAGKLPRNEFKREADHFKAVPLEYADKTSTNDMEDFVVERVVIRAFVQTLPENERRALGKLLDQYKRYELVDLLGVNNAMGVSRKLRKCRQKLQDFLSADDDWRRDPGKE